MEQQNTLELINNLYNKSPNINDWTNNNEPNSDLIWKFRVASQSKNIQLVANLVDEHKGIIETPRVISYHTSKSVKFPVSCFKLIDDNNKYIITRDNFYNIKMAVISSKEINLPYYLIHQVVSEAAYIKEREKCRTYCKDSENDEKYKDDSWAEKWSGRTFLREDGIIYNCESVHRVYCEGMGNLGLPNEVFTRYEKGKNMFTCALGRYSELAFIMSLLNGD
jgi:hypothetical protein